MVKLSCRGLKVDKLCMVKIDVKADTFWSRSVAPDLLPLSIPAVCSVLVCL